MMHVRTKLLLAGAALAPAAIVTYRMSTAELAREAQSRDAALVGVHPGWLPIGMFLVGVVCLLAFLVSLAFDVKQIRSESR